MFSCPRWIVIPFTSCPSPNSQVFGWSCSLAPSRSLGSCGLWITCPDLVGGSSPEAPVCPVPSHDMRVSSRRRRCTGRKRDGGAIRKGDNRQEAPRRSAHSPRSASPGVRTRRAVGCTNSQILGCRWSHPVRRSSRGLGNPHRCPTHPQLLIVPPRPNPTGLSKEPPCHPTS